MMMEKQDSLTRKKNGYACEMICWKECIHMGWSAQNKHRVFHWVKTTLPNVTLGHWKGREVLGVKDSRMDSLVAAGRNDDSHKRAKSWWKKLPSSAKPICFYKNNKYSTNAWTFISLVCIREKFRTAQNFSHYKSAHLLCAKILDIYFLLPSLQLVWISTTAK